MIRLATARGTDTICRPLRGLRFYLDVNPSAEALGYLQSSASRTTVLPRR